jgi:hypothetical protein
LETGLLFTVFSTLVIIHPVSIAESCFCERSLVMRWFIGLALVGAMLVGSESTSGRDKPASAKQIQFSLCIFEGDPLLGSREAGTLKVLAEPRVTTLENRPCTLISGGEIPVREGAQVEYVEYGTKFQCKPGLVKDGKIRLDLTVSNVTVGEKTEKRIQLTTESTRTITTVRLGEVIKIRVGQGSADKQVWAELSVDEVQPEP